MKYFISPKMADPLKPILRWAQTKEKLFLTLELSDIQVIFWGHFLHKFPKPGVNSALFILSTVSVCGVDRRSASFSRWAFLCILSQSLQDLAKINHSRKGSDSSVNLNLKVSICMMEWNISGNFHNLCMVLKRSPTGIMFWKFDCWATAVYVWKQSV